MPFENVNKKRYVGHVIDFCDMCNDKLPLFKFKSQWLCEDCKKVYKRSLESPRDTRDADRVRTRFHNMVDGATDDAHTAPFSSDK